ASHTSDDDDDDDDDDDQQPHGQGVSISSNDTKKVESMDTEQHSDTATMSVIESLADEHALLLTTDCVYLIRMPVDPDAIH
ncbi:unnamed protein product, partial [Rotaria magnacalcarata]